MEKQYDIIVVGGGASGIFASILLAQKNKKVLIVEKLSRLGKKLLASGGKRCNISNTLDNHTFIEAFGKQGKFLRDAIENFNYKDLIKFFDNLGVKIETKDGFRLFPSSHSSSTIVEALEKELQLLGVDIVLNTTVKKLLIKDNKVYGVTTPDANYYANSVLLATGGMGYSNLGGGYDGYALIESTHKIVSLAPAMMPLFTKERWVANCTADTIPKATIKIAIKKYAKQKASGDLIFTKSGLRGPLILDFAKHINKLLLKYEEVPVLINLTQGKTEDDIVQILKKYQSNILIETLTQLIPKSVAIEFCKLLNIKEDTTYKNLEGKKKDALIKILANTPFTIVGNDGFKNAMVTTGGVSLKQIDPKTMQSKIIDNLYFAGEIIDLDGPCGGYNLQLAFSTASLVVDSTC